MKGKKETRYIILCICRFEHKLCNGLSHISVCGGELTGAWGNFTSPNYPNKYPSNMRCEWNITAPKGTHIYLHFTDFELSYSCGYDNITVFVFLLSLKYMC